MPNEFDTDFAKTVSTILATTLSSYSASPDSLLGNLDVIKIKYGDQHITRPLSHIWDDVMLDRRFNAPEQQADKLVQELDAVCLSKRLRIDRVDYAADPSNVANHVRDSLNVVRDGIEKYLIEGSSTRVTMYGLSDFPNATAGTINRPEVAGEAAVTGTWGTVANMQSDISDALVDLIADKFRGQAALLAPSIIRPAIAKQLASTAVPVKQWIENAIGLPIIFSPFVHEAATAADFNCYLVDLSKIHIGLSDLKVDSYYDQKDHAYFIDFEIYMCFLADPLHNGTEWVKGVALLDACSL